MTVSTQNNGSRTEEPIRLLFEMTRDDNPRLYDDLIRFNKGTKRVNRLRFLAYEGLTVQTWPMSGRSQVPPPPAAHSSHSDQRSSLAVSRDEAKQVSGIFSDATGTEEDWDDRT